MDALGAESGPFLQPGPHFTSGSSLVLSLLACELARHAGQPWTSPAIQFDDLASLKKDFELTGLLKGCAGSWVGHGGSGPWAGRRPLALTSCLLTGLCAFLGLQFGLLAGPLISPGIGNVSFLSVTAAALHNCKPYLLIA